MKVSTTDAARKLGVTVLTLQRHAKAKTWKFPPVVKVGGVSVRLWTDADIQRARKALAELKPGRKKKLP